MSLSNFIIRDKCSYGGHSLEVIKRVSRSHLLQSGDIAQELLLEDELPLLVPLRALIGLVVLPPDHLAALFARYVPHNVPTRGHVAVARVAGGDVDDRVEEVGFAVLAAEVLSGMSVRKGNGWGLGHTYPTYDGVVVCEMGLAVLAAVDLARV